MEISNQKIPNKTIAYYGAIIAIAATIAYSLIVMLYVIIRSSAIIYGIMPTAELNTILLVNNFSVAYSVAFFSLLMAIPSAVAGAFAAAFLKRLLCYFNPKFILRLTLLISCITALAFIILLYLLLYSLLKDWMTFNHAETFFFWFLFPAAIFFAVCITGGNKLNKLLDTGYKTTC